MIEQRLGNFERALENALFAYRLEPCLLIAWDQLLSAFSFILNENMDRKQCLNLCESDDYVEFVPDHANTKVFKGTLSIVKNIHYLNLKARLGSIVDDACTCKSNGKLCDIKFRIQCHSFSEFRSSYQNDLCDSLAKPSYEFKIPMDSFEDFSVTTKRLKTEIKHKFDGIDRKEDIFITCSNQNPMLKNSTCDEESILGTEIQVNPSNKSNYQIKYPTGFFQDGQKIHSHSYSTIYNDVFSNESTYEILQRAIILYNNRNNNEALIRLEVLQKRDPYRMYECLEYLSDIYFMSGRQDDLAALSRLSKSISKFHRTTCYVTGNYFSLCGDSAKAAIQFKRAVRLDQNFSTAWILLAHQFIELRLPLPAINSYRKAAKVAPFDFRTWYGLAQIYEALGKIGLAIEYYERASYTSNDFKVFMSLGRCLFQHGRYRSAINAYHKATQYVIKHDSEKMEPDDHLNIAQAYTNLHPKNSEERIDFKELSFKHNCSYLRMLLPNPNLNVENDLTVNSENQVLATDYYSVPNNSTSCESKNEKIRQDSLIENIINDQCLRADFLEFVSQILRTGDNLSAIWRIAVMELLTVIEANDLSHISTKATHLKKLI